jgi:uncharacterized membrane protein
MTLARSKRIQSIDFLRGIVMIIMALDHCRDFLHYNVTIDQNPLDFSSTTVFLFMTRWITNFCAPVFVFLSGTSIFLYSSKDKSKKQVAFFLLTRGIWLMLVEILIIQPLWDFNLIVIFLQVIWAIGLSMVFLSVLQFLPYRVLLFIGLILVFTHNLLDKTVIESPFWKSVTWSIIHQQHSYLINDHLLFTVQYPFLPWLGLMILGYSAGRLYLPDIQAATRKKILRITGIAAILLFVLIRLFNQYGDMHSWTQQKTSVFTMLDFIKTTKYPPSLLFILMTIGPALIMLSLVENVQGGLSRKIIVFGKVPFFYYILHVFLIHSIAWLCFFATGHSWKELDFTHFRDGSLPYGSGYPLWFVYAAWISVIVILYFPCQWYANYKASHRKWWLSYV